MYADRGRGNIRLHASPLCCISLTIAVPAVPNNTHWRRAEVSERFDFVQVQAYSYQRFSSSSQASGDSLARQSSLAKAYADRHGLQLDDALTFRDLGVSGFRGRNAAHGELASFLEAVRVGRIAEGSFLLIESLDRLSRDNIIRAQAILTNLVIAGINVVSLADNRLYSEKSLADDPLGLIYALIVFIRANEESAIKSLRAREAWVRKRDFARTTVMSDRVPDWLSVQKGRILPIIDRVEVLRHIFGLAEAGATPESIANTLNHEDVPRWRVDKPWTRAAVFTILNNRRVTGILPLYVSNYERNAECRTPIGVLEGYFPRIIEPEAFLRVWALSSTRRRGGNAAKGNIFANLLRCATCGADIRHRTVGGRGHAVLICAAAAIAHGCTAPEYAYAVLEKQTLIELTSWAAEGIVWVRSLDLKGGVNARGVHHRPLGNRALVIKHDRLLRSRASCEAIANALPPSAADYLRTRSGRCYLVNDLSTILTAAQSAMLTATGRVLTNASLRRIFSDATLDLETGKCAFRCGAASELLIEPQ